MACPYHSLARLPGQIIDDSARTLRRALEENLADPEQLLREHTARIKDASADSTALQAEAYAGASFVIEQFWSFIQRQNTKEVFTLLRKNHPRATHRENVTKFMAYFLILLTQMRDRFVEEARARMKAEAETGKDDALLLLFFSAAQKRYPDLGRLPFPQISDLVVMFGRMVELAPAVGERDIGRPPSQEELFRLFRNPSVIQFFLEVMSNSREAVLPLIALLEGNLEADLNDLDRVFRPQLFEVQRKGEAFVLGLTPEIRARYHRDITNALARAARQGERQPHAMGCPVLYSGIFKELYNWVRTSYEEWETAASS